MLSVRTVRTLALLVCVAGIAGMIVTSILNHNGAAVTLGLITSVAVLCSMVAKAVAADTERRLGAPATRRDAAPEELADLVESQVLLVVSEGADEGSVRQLVGEAVRLGRMLATSDAEPDFASGGPRGRRRSPHAGNV